MEQVLYKLPDGWEWMQLGEALDVRDGTHDSPKYVERGFPLVTSKNITGKGLDVQNVKYISQEDFDAINKRSKVDVGDMLFAMIGTIGFPTVVTDEPSYAIKNVALFKKRQDDQNMDFFKYFLESPYAIESMLAQAKGAAQKFVGLRVLRSFNIPLPPKVEQKRIVEKLDALLTRIDTAIEHLKESFTLADAMFMSGLDKAFNPLSLRANGMGLYELPKGWMWKELGSISLIGTGVTPSKGRADYYHNGKINWVTSKVTGDDFVNDSEQKITEVALSECRLKRYPAGTLIVAMYGQGKTRGQVSELLIESTINQALAAVVVSPEHDSKFVKYFLKRSYFLLRSKANGGTQENLNLSIIKAIRVPVPDAQQQRQIVMSLDALNAQLNQVKIELTSKLELLNQLKASNLDSAFKGEL